MGLKNGAVKISMSRHIEGHALLKLTAGKSKCGIESACCFGLSKAALVTRSTHCMQSIAYLVSATENKTSAVLSSVHSKERVAARFPTSLRACSTGSLALLREGPPVCPSGPGCFASPMNQPTEGVQREFLSLEHEEHCNVSPRSTTSKAFVRAI